MKKHLILLIVSIASSPCLGMAEPTVVTNPAGALPAGQVIVDTAELEHVLKATAENAARKGFERGIEEGANRASATSTSDSLFSPIKQVFSFIPWKYLLSGTGLAVIGSVICWRIYGANPQQLRAVRARVDADADARSAGVRNDALMRAAVLAGATKVVSADVAAADGCLRGVAASLREQQDEESEALRMARESLEELRMRLLQKLANPMRPSALLLTLAQDRNLSPEASLMDALQRLDATSLQNVEAIVALKGQLDGLAAASMAGNQGHQEALAGVGQRLQELGAQFAQADQTAAGLHSSLDDAQACVGRIRRGVTVHGGAGRSDLSLMARALLEEG